MPMLTKMPSKIHLLQEDGPRPSPFLASQSLAQKLRDVGEPVIAAPGTELFKAGEISRGVFLVLSGRLALWSGDDPIRVTRIAEAGSLLGLPATVRNVPYSLSAEPVTDVKLCVVTPELLDEVLRHDVDAALEVINLLAQEISCLRSLAVYRAL